MIITIVLFEH